MAKSTHDTVILHVMSEMVCQKILQAFLDRYKQVSV